MAPTVSSISAPLTAYVPPAPAANVAAPAPIPAAPPVAPVGHDPYAAAQSLIAQAQTANAATAAPKPPTAPGPAEAAYGAQAPAPAKSAHTFEATVPVGDKLVTVQFTVIGDATQGFPPPFKADGEGPPENTVHIAVAAGATAAVAVQIGAVNSPSPGKADPASPSDPDAAQDVSVSLS